MTTPHRGELRIDDPSTGEFVGSVATGDDDAVHAAVGAAVAAHDGWARTPAAERGALLRHIAGRIRDAAAELAELNARETGKVIGDARGAAGTLAQMARARELLRQPTLEFGD
jgi:acyl-CoA reductase-like NAD-dependent aldehyde dehydrogenase